MSEPHFIQLHDPAHAPLALEAAAGLMANKAQVSPKFFYDALGSRLFDAITELDEYYPTRTEAAILQAYRAELAASVLAHLGPRPSLVDLGAGNCAKAASLFECLNPVRYVAVDISVDFLRAALYSLQLQHPDVSMTGVGLDFSSHLKLPSGVLDGPSLLFYPGSSIGNFSPDTALQLLRQAHALSDGGALLVGVDLAKDRALLEAAYDDALGVTAAFNLNLLRHLNRLLGSNFQMREWRHLALYDAQAGRVEMHLQARQALTVCWPGGERRFLAEESIHTENSYKWQRGDFEALLRDAGFRAVKTWTDPQAWFAVSLALAG